ncbi:MAG: HAD-IC family P-type ATPase, partial [Acidobacteria bacterium]|nr:HAD-IC family P-type ATPase [Acidobacteriota bacterium]
ATVLPADKFAVVEMLQHAGHHAAMVGDGVNDAPALKQAQMGIAVLTASDVAKSAAGILLTEPGLSGILAAVQEGRSAFQRILTYTLLSMTRKVVQVLFLVGGLAITGHAIITPVLVVIIMITGDFLSMSSSTDNVRTSPKPNVWRVGNVAITSILLGTVDLAFCLGVLVLGRSVLDLPQAQLQTLAAVTLVFTGQSVFSVSRERGHLWSSRPSRGVLVSSLAAVVIIVTLATIGLFMAPLPLGVIAGTAGASIALAFVLDIAKTTLFSHLAIA